MPNIEEEARKVAGKDGLITYPEFIRFAGPTELFKIEFHDRVFHKCDEDEKDDKKIKKKDSKKKVNILLYFLHICNQSKSTVRPSIARTYMALRVENNCMKSRHQH